MKKLMFASLALLGSVALANAQEATPQESNKATEAVAPAPAPAADQQTIIQKNQIYFFRAEGLEAILPLVGDGHQGSIFCKKSLKNPGEC